MKHSRLIVASCFVLLLFLLAGCHKNKEEQTLVYPSFRLGIQQGTSSIEYKTAELFAKKVDELSNGTISIKIFPDGKLGDDISMVQQVMDGLLDITYAETGRLGLWVKEAEIFGYPFAFDDFNHLLRTLESDYGQCLKNKFMDHNVIVLATGYNGTRQTTSNRPINSINDMKDLRFRVPNAYANKMFVTVCGAKAVTVPFNEVYKQLKAGLIDAEENPLPLIYANNFCDLQDYIAITNHIINDCNIIISKESYDILNDWQKAAITQAAIIASRFQTESFMQEEAYLLTYFESQGIEVTYPKRSDFRKACIPIYENYISIYGDRAYKAIIENQR